jgi:uncharacterized protein YlxW (UPF0749 family)
MSAPDSRPERRTFSPDFLTELFRNPLDPGYADAAARRAAGHTPKPATAAVLRGLTVLVLVVLGLLFVVAYRKTVAEEPNRTATRTGLIEQIERKRDGTQALEARSDLLRGQIADLRDREIGGPAIAALRNLEGVTGVSRVRGDGIAVTITDGRPYVNPKNGELDDGRVRDGELQKLANALWSAGAEAVTVNGQRLTSTTTIRLAGEAIQVEKLPVSSPYELVAIGPDELRELFESDANTVAIRGLAPTLGMKFEIRDVEDQTLAAAPEPDLRHARPPAPVPSTTAGSVTPTAPSSTPSEGGR